MEHYKFFDYVLPVVPGGNCVAPFLSDYRLQYMILNDYSIFMEMNAVHNEIEKGQKTAQKLLALAVYKNIWPRYYEALSSGKQTRFFVPLLKNVKCSELAVILTDGENPYLTYDSLCYLGYSTKEIVQNLVWRIRKTEQTEEQIKLVREMPNNEFSCKCLEEILITDGQDENDADKTR